MPDYLIASLEKGYTREPPTAVGRADVVVVLGGGTWPSRHNVFGFDFKDASDRLITGTELMRQGKAEAFVAGCGFWRDGGRRLSQSPLIRQWIDAWHLFDAPVYNLGTSLDTYEEGRAFEKLADQHGWEEVILVTSAIHMRRAEAVFEKIGFDVECVATDFVSLDVPPSRRPNNPFPTLNGFEKVELYLHEKLGWIAYRLRGRI
ncbi:MAG: YdcF family protein [Verrucomicrobia bacterium]|nr:YdcF family protein [Verrucomicrobiota bacterium]